jgi:peptidoglycan DL-endopeptidase CwlO
MTDVMFSGRKSKKDDAGKHRKAPYNIAMWQVVAGAVSAVLVVTLMATGLIVRITTPAPVAPKPGAYQAAATEAYDAAVEQSTAEEDAAIAEQEQLWITHVRELSAKQQEEMAMRQRLADEEAQAAAQANAKAAASAAMLMPPTMGTAIVAGDQTIAQAIDIYLIEKGSPMAGLGRAFVSAGKAFNVDPFLVVAISGKESSWGKHCFLPYNAWGWGDVSFTDWDNAIFSYTRLLNEEYTSKGRTTPAVIAPIYCPPNYVEWTKDVTAFYNDLTAIHAGMIR